MRTILPILVFLTSFGLTVPVAAQEEAVAPVRASLAFALGQPAAAAAVDDALDTTRADPERGEELVRALVAAGGVEAARGLAALLEHREPGVRTQALLGLGRLGLRGDRLASAVHERLADAFAPPAERRAAVVALGAVGDGRDVAALLALASPDSDDANVRATAFRALAAIARVRLPFVYARWTYWWKKQEDKGVARVERAIKALEDAPAGEAAFAQEATLAAHGWMYPESVRPALKRWLRGQPAALIATACRLTAYLRLGDLAEDVRRAGEDRFASDAVRAEAQKAAHRLGVAQDKPAR